MNKYKFTKMVYVVDSSQKDHFYRLYETLKRLDTNKNGSSMLGGNVTFEDFYVPFGRLTNMSTRRGNVEFLSDLISEAKQVAFESMEFSKSRAILSTTH
jgi:arginyl-tRNA synthetase